MLSRYQETTTDNYDDTDHFLYYRINRDSCYNNYVYIYLPFMSLTHTVINPPSIFKAKTFICTIIL